jgi:hypothetical protein
MNFEQIWPIISQIATGLLLPLTGALGLWGASQIKRWQARSDLKTRKQNALDATQAIAQLYPNQTPEIKQKLALEWAQHLNCIAGVDDKDDKTQLILNEASVRQNKVDTPNFTAESTSGTTAGTTVTNSTSVFTPTAPIISETLDGSLPPKGMG